MKKMVLCSVVSVLVACKAVAPIASVSDTAAPVSENAYVLFVVQTQTDAAGSLESDADAGFNLTLQKLDKSGKQTPFPLARVKPGQPYLIELPPGVYYVQKAVFRDWSETFLPQPTLFIVRRGQINYAGDISISTQYTHNSNRGNQVTNWYVRHQEVDDNQATINWVKSQYPELAGRWPVKFTHVYDTAATIAE